MMVVALLAVYHCLFEFVYVLCLLLIWRIKFSLSLSLSLRTISRKSRTVDVSCCRSTNLSTRYAMRISVATMHQPVRRCHHRQRQ